jgi:hypothetical protein
VVLGLPCLESFWVRPQAAEEVHVRFGTPPSSRFKATDFLLQNPTKLEMGERKRYDRPRLGDDTAAPPFSTPHFPLKVEPRRRRASLLLLQDGSR